MQQNYKIVHALCQRRTTTATTTTLITTASTSSTTKLAPTVQFDLFQKMFNVTFENTSVAIEKFAVFSAYLDKIAKIHAAASAGGVTYTLVINKFAYLVSIRNF